MYRHGIEIKISYVIAVGDNISARRQYRCFWAVAPDIMPTTAMCLAAGDGIHCVSALRRVSPDDRSIKRPPPLSPVAFPAFISVWAIPNPDDFITSLKWRRHGHFLVARDEAIWTTRRTNTFWAPIIHAIITNIMLSTYWSMSNSYFCLRSMLKSLIDKYDDAIVISSR